MEERARRAVERRLSTAVRITAVPRPATDGPAALSPGSALLLFQFVVILESVLAKLSRYDEGTLFSSFLSFTVSSRHVGLHSRTVPVGKQSPYFLARPRLAAVVCR